MAGGKTTLPAGGGDGPPPVDEPRKDPPTQGLSWKKGVGRARLRLGARGARRGSAPPEQRREDGGVTGGENNVDGMVPA